MEGIKIIGKKPLLWLTTWVVLSVAALLVTHFFPEKWEGYMCYIVAAVIVLFSALAVYSAIHSKQNSEATFRDTFSRLFDRNWVFCYLFVMTMSILIIIWTTVICYILEFHGAYFISNLFDVSVVAPLREEFQYRVLPFTIAAIPMAMVTSRRWKTVLCCFFGLMIFCVQMQFGYAHVSIYRAMDGTESIGIHLLIQGVGGVSYAITYGVVLYRTFRNMIAKQKVPNKCFAVLFATPIAYICSCCVHGINNLYIVMSNLF